MFAPRRSQSSLRITIIRLLTTMRNLTRRNRREQGTPLTPIFKTYFYTIAPEINPVSKVILGDKTWPL